jgi:hypothetical protein
MAVLTIRYTAPQPQQSRKKLSIDAATKAAPELAPTAALTAELGSAQLTAV